MGQRRRGHSTGLGQKASCPRAKSVPPVRLPLGPAGAGRRRPLTRGNGAAVRLGPARGRRRAANGGPRLALSLSEHISDRRPTEARSPAWTKWRERRPGLMALSSIIALSVSTTATGSPADTSSPGCFSHSDNSTSSMAMPEAGMKSLPLRAPSEQSWPSLSPPEKQRRSSRAPHDDIAVLNGVRAGPGNCVADRPGRQAPSGPVRICRAMWREHCVICLK